jgi:HEPN domain-containing protein
MIEDTQSWLRKAKGDMTSAEILHDSLQFDTSCYHSQQAAEKYLKAILCELGNALTKTHDLDRLVDIIETSGVAIPDYLKIQTTSVNQYATLTRYPVMMLYQAIQVKRC